MKKINEMNIIDIYFELMFMREYHKDELIYRIFIKEPKNYIKMKMKIKL